MLLSLFINRLQRNQSALNSACYHDLYTFHTQYHLGSVTTGSFDVDLALSNKQQGKTIL